MTSSFSHDEHAEPIYVVRETPGVGSLRFFRRVKVLPGLTMNLSKSGPSFSFGVRGAHVTMGKHGVRRTVGIPGTGIFYTSRSGHHTGVHHH
jgi:hypothetical protein